jgi:2-isopropylmalate synthase
METMKMKKKNAVNKTEKKVLIYDTTLRDGTQAEGISLSLQDKIAIAKKLDQFGVHYIEGGWPGSNPKDLAFFKEIKKAEIKNAKIAAFGSTRRMNSKVQDDTNIKALLESKNECYYYFWKSLRLSCHRSVSYDA